MACHALNAETAYTKVEIDILKLYYMQVGFDVFSKSKFYHTAKKVHETFQKERI